jgi:hypothetical protein
MGRPQQRIKSFVGRQTFTDSSRLVFDLPRDYDYESLIIRISGTTTLSVAGSAVRAEAPLQLLKFISVKANGTDLLDGVNGMIAHRLGIFRRGQLAPLTPQAAATATAQAFAGVVILDRAVIDGIRSKDGNFPSRGLSTFQLELAMGLATDCFTGTPTGTVTAGTVEVFAIRIVEDVGADGRMTLPRVVTKRTQLTRTYASANSNDQIRLNTGNIYRGLLIRSYGYTTANEPSDSGLNNIKVQVGNQVIADLTYAALRAMNACDYELSSVPTGYAVLDFMNMGGPAGKLSDCLDLRAGQEAWLFLDANGATNNAVDLCQMEYVPYNPKYWGINT